MGTVKLVGENVAVFCRAVSFPPGIFHSETCPLLFRRRNGFRILRITDLDNSLASRLRLKLLAGVAIFFAGTCWNLEYTPVGCPAKNPELFL